MSRSHLVIPDTQVKSGVPLDHIHALAAMIVEHQPDVIIHLGDHWDMPSLSAYDGKGSKSMEGRRYRADIAAGNRAMKIINDAINSVKGYDPEKHFFCGNHENRIIRAIEADPQKLDGVIGYHDFTELEDWCVYDYQKIGVIDGVAYSHVFVNQFSGRSIGGSIDNRLNKLKFSFTQGHIQMFQYGQDYLNNGQCIQGLVAGAFYMHDEDYKGPQGNNHWRGVVYKTNVSHGNYDFEMIKLETLLKLYGE